MGNCEALTHWPWEPHICVNVSLSSLVQEMAWRQVGANPFLEPTLTSHRKKAKEHSWVNSCLILRILLRKIEIQLSSVFSCHISLGVNGLNMLTRPHNQGEIIWDPVTSSSLWLLNYLYKLTIQQYNSKTIKFIYSRLHKTLKKKIAKRLFTNINCSC